MAVTLDITKQKEMLKVGGRNEFKKDTGKWMSIIHPDDIDLNNPKTLGLRLLQALMSQVSGYLEVVRSPTRYSQ